jgi:hypothetical protein
MNPINKIVAATVLLILAAAVPLYGSTPNSGADGNLEWRKLRNLQLPAKAIDFVNSLDGKYTFVLTEGHRVTVYDTRGNLQGSIPVDAGVSAIDIAPQGQLLYLIDTDKNRTTTLAVEFIITIDTANSAFKGKNDAPVTIVVFSDFQ